MIINEVRAEKRIFKFRRPIEVVLTQEGGFYLISNYRFNLHAAKRGVNEAVEEFGTLLDNLWDNYALADVRTLSGDAIDLRDRLLSEIEVIDIE